MPHADPTAVLTRIGGRVRRRRQALDLSMKQLAEMAGLSPRFVADVESGSGNIAVGRLAGIAAALDVPLAELVREVRPSAEREAIDRLLDGRSDDELAHARRALEVLLGRGRPGVVALLGVRGAGKSVVGERVAHELELPFVELDERIEAAAGMSRADLFAFHGEPYFRQLESRCLAEVVTDGLACVLALPGGVVGNDSAMTLLRAMCFTVWLRAEPEDYWRRVFEQGDTRPIEGRENAMEELRRLVRERDALYGQADLVVQTSQRSVDQVVELVLKGLRRNGVP
ncbi:MAG: shikimate kinase [Planctomycetota bacterium]